MLVEFLEVRGPLDNQVGPVQVNPRHVVLVRRGVNASNPDAQSFISEMRLVGDITVRVEGSVSDVRKACNLPSVR